MMISKKLDLWENGSSQMMMTNKIKLKIFQKLKNQELPSSHIIEFDENDINYSNF